MNVMGHPVHAALPVTTRGQLDILSTPAEELYRGEQKGMQILLSMTQARPGRAVKQEQEQNSRNHVQAF